MPCILKVDRRLKAEILSFPGAVRDEIGADLLSLQDNPLPADRQDLDHPNGYYHQLRCGYFVSWELIGETEDILRLITLGACRNLTIRILGAGASSPK